MRGRDGGDGVDRRLLDPTLRDPRSAWLRGGGGERPRRQARPGPQDRCQRRRLAAAPARIRAAARELPTRRRDRDPAELSAPARAAARSGGRPHPAHAEGADRDEPAAPSLLRNPDISRVTDTGQSRVRAEYAALTLLLQSSLTLAVGLQGTKGPNSTVAQGVRYCRKLVTGGVRRQRVERLG